MASFGSANEYQLIQLNRLPPAHVISRYGGGEIWERIAKGSQWDRLIDRIGGASWRDGRRAARRLLADGEAGLAINAYQGPGRDHSDCNFAAAVQRAHEVTLTVRPWREDKVRAAINPDRVEPLAPQVLLTMSLIMEPITWSPGNDLSNGQHRLAGARVAGLEEILVRQVR